MSTESNTAESGLDRQTEATAAPVCLSKVHDSLIRILENPKNHVDGWTGIDRIQTRLPREYRYGVKDIRACLAGCLAHYVEVRADQHGTITHARRTDATYTGTVTPTLLSHDEHVAQRKAWEKTINDLAAYPNEQARADLRRRMAAANIDPRPDWMDEYEDALEAGAATRGALPRMVKAVDQTLLLMLTAIKEKGEDIESLRDFTADLCQTLQTIHGAGPLPEKKTTAPKKKTPPPKPMARTDIMRAASGSRATPTEQAAFEARVEEVLAAEETPAGPTEDRQTETPVCLAPEPKAEPELPTESAEAQDEEEADEEEEQPKTRRGRRPKTQEMTVEEALDAFLPTVEELASEMGTWRDNIEEKFSGTAKYEEVSAVTDDLSELEGRSE